MWASGQAGKRASGIEILSAAKIAPVPFEIGAATQAMCGYVALKRVKKIIL
jgi:hypothetical protein